MGWIKNFFLKNNSLKPSIEANRNLDESSKGYDLFRKGKECYLNNKKADALIQFDKAIDCGFAENYPEELVELYDVRGVCLQSLEYHFDAIDDFNNAIKLSPHDCDKYFCRSQSKAAILDYIGALVDIEKAIEVSKIDNAHNIAFNEQAYDRGFQNGAKGFYQNYLMMIKLDFDYDLQEKEKIKNSSNPNELEYRKEVYQERREKKLNKILRRSK